jgi:nitrate reductase (NAD(P)H)
LHSTLTLSSSPQPPYPPAAGAGHKIIRCEVSLDDGKTWRLATETHNTPPNKYGKHWAWVWWSLDVPIGE